MNGLVDDFEVCPSGTHRVLDLKDALINELRAENRSLRVRLISAEAALQFTPGQLDALHQVIRRLGDVIDEVDS